MSNRGPSAYQPNAFPLGQTGSHLYWLVFSIQRREVSWTLTKKLDTFAGPGEIKRREVVLDPQVSSEEIMSREVELGCESWTLSLIHI